MIYQALIRSDRIPKGKAVFLFLGLIMVAFLIGTVARVSLLFIYPVVTLGIVIFFGLRPSPSFLFLLICVLTGTVFSFLNGAYLSYKFVSLFYMIPFLLLVFATPPDPVKYGEVLRYFIIAMAAVAIINDIIGFGQVAKNPGSDDSFLGLYSQYSLSLNGLVLVNNMLFFYFLVLTVYKRSLTNLIITIFFLVCFMIGFYGAGLIICAIALILAFLRFQLLSLMKIALAGLLVMVVLYFGMMAIKPTALEYNISNLKKITALDLQYGPRKVISFYNYAVSYPKDIKDFLLGSGPGTFNSRSAFMVGSPSYFQSGRMIKSPSKPYYFQNFAYPLWNEKNTSQALYLDGFRNQPFSSLLAFLGEYGLIFTFLFSILYYNYYKKVAAIYSELKDYPEARIAFRFFKYIIVLLPLLLVIDNFVEFPEIIIMLALAMKFSHSELLHLRNLKFASERQ